MLLLFLKNLNMLNTVKKSNVISISIKSFSHNILKYYIVAFFSLFKLKTINLKVQPIKRKRITILKSPHKYKKAQEHFQLKIYKSVLVIHDINAKDILTLLVNKPQGIFVKVKIKQAKTKMLLK